MFGIGMPEMLLILAVALIVIGPKKLPDLAKSLGKALGEFKKAASDLKDSLQIETEINALKSALDDDDRDSKPKNGPNAAPSTAAPVDDRDDAGGGGGPLQEGAPVGQDPMTAGSDRQKGGDPSDAGDAAATGPDSSEAGSHKG